MGLLILRMYCQLRKSTDYCPQNKNCYTTKSTTAKTATLGGRLKLAKHDAQRLSWLTRVQNSEQKRL